MKCTCSPNAKAFTKVDGHVVIYTTVQGEPRLALGVRAGSGQEADIQNGRRQPGVRARGGSQVELGGKK